MAAGVSNVGNASITPFGGSYLENNAVISGTDRLTFHAACGKIEAHVKSKPAIFAKTGRDAVLGIDWPLPFGVGALTMKNRKKEEKEHGWELLQAKFLKRTIFWSHCWQSPEVEKLARKRGTALKQLSVLHEAFSFKSQTNSIFLNRTLLLTESIRKNDW
jgi:hypothetical protein